MVESIQAYCEQLGSASWNSVFFTASVSGLAIDTMLERLDSPVDFPRLKYSGFGARVFRSFGKSYADAGSTAVITFISNERTIGPENSNFGCAATITGTIAPL